MYITLSSHRELSFKLVSTTQTRKADHLRICLDEDVQFHETTMDLERYRFAHCCLPELDRVVTSRRRSCTAADFFDDGRHGIGGTINHRLAEVAQHYKIAMGVGSPRGGGKAQVAGTFAVRSRALIYSICQQVLSNSTTTTGWMNACAWLIC